MILTDVAIATINRLNARHPVRRVLQHTFHTLLIGNLENVNAHFAGAKSFSVTLFSHDAPGGVGARGRTHLATSTSRTSRPTSSSPGGEPPRRRSPIPTATTCWSCGLSTSTTSRATSRSTTPTTTAVRADAAIAGWADELDRLLPNPIARPEGGLTREWVARVCATVIHLSTVEHDILNNVAWDYCTFGFVVAHRRAGLG